MSRRLCHCSNRRFYLTGWLRRICTSIVPTIPLLWRGGGHKHFVMSAFSNHVKVLQNVTLFVATATNSGSIFQQPHISVLKHEICLFVG